MPNWSKLVIPLVEGKRTNEFNLSTVQTPSLVEANNAVFDYEGGVRARPGFRFGTTTGSARVLDANGKVSYTAYTPSTVGVPFPVRDRLGERLGLWADNRIWVEDSDSDLFDRGGHSALKVSRSQALSTGWSPNPREFVTSGVAGLLQRHLSGGTAYSFGSGSSSQAGEYTIASVDDERQVKLRAVSGVTVNGALGAAGARCGSTEALVTGGGATSGLHMHFGPGSGASVSLDAAQRGGESDSGTTRLGRPCICADYDATNFFVVYLTSTANQVKVLRVDTSGAILTTATFTVTNAVGVWCTNTDVATNRLVLAVTVSSGTIVTKVLNATTLVDLAIDVTLESGVGATLPPCVTTCGVAEDGEVWVVGTSSSNTDARVFVYKRSLTAATSRLYFRRYTPTWGVINTAPASFSGTVFFPQHQPIKLGGRVLVGMSAFHGATLISPTRGPSFTPAATWCLWDITDLWATGVATGATSGNLRDPVIAARGPLDGSCPPWVAYTAVLAQGAPGPFGTTLDPTNYRFASIEWSDISVPAASSRTQPALVGSGGNLVINEVTTAALVVDHCAQSTLLAGGVLRTLAGGTCHPVGFPAQERPVLPFVGTSGAGGSLTGASYNVAAVWAFTDENGQVTRSTPTTQVITGLTPGTSRLTDVRVTLPHFCERDGVVIELYMSAPAPSSVNASMYLVAQTAYDPTNTAGYVSFAVTEDADTTNRLLYTTGGVMVNQTVSAQGGIAMLGDRCWVSDGEALFASKLGDVQAGNDAPAWNVDGPLVVRLPVGSGAVTALRPLDDKLVVLTETGVWLLNGAGPDDLGNGPSFSLPVKRADIGLVHPRGTASTPYGVIWIGAPLYNRADPTATGLFIMTPGLEFQPVSRFIKQGNSFGELCYVTARQLLVWAGADVQASDDTEFDSTRALHVLDLGVNKWSKWIPSIGRSGFSGSPPPDQFMTAIQGYLVLSGVQDDGGGDVPVHGAQTVVDSDLTLSGADFIVLSITLKGVKVAGDAGARGRVRSAQVVWDPLEFDPGDETTLTQVSLTTYPDDHANGVTATETLSVPSPVTSMEVFAAAQKTNRVDITVTAQGNGGGRPNFTQIVLLVKGDARNKTGERGN